MISSLVPISSRTGRERERKRAVITRAERKESIRETLRERFSSFSSRAPYCWEIRMEKPWVRPEQTATLIQLNQSAEPKAASALTPTTCPTTAVSTRVYAC